MKVEAYLSFEGRSEEAIEFYRKALGAEVTMLTRFKEVPAEIASQISPESADKVMHASLRIGETQVLLTDGHCSGKGAFQGISLSLTVKDDAEAQRHFNALSEGGQVQLALHKTFFARSFGMLADRFGVHWLVIAPL